MNQEPPDASLPHGARTPKKNRQARMHMAAQMLAGRPSQFSSPACLKMADSSSSLGHQLQQKRNNTCLERRHCQMVVDSQTQPNMPGTQNNNMFSTQQNSNMFAAGRHPFSKLFACTMVNFIVSVSFLSDPVSAC
jgi:hypothetical protein